MAACIKDLRSSQAIDPIKVKNAMNCVKCHDGIETGTISYPFNPGNFKVSIADHLIRNSLMPPRSNLNHSERMALIRCLNFEYFGGFKDPVWGGSKTPGTLIKSLLSVPCSEPPKLIEKPSSQNSDAETKATPSEDSH